VQHPRADGKTVAALAARGEAMKFRANTFVVLMIAVLSAACAATQPISNQAAIMAPLNQILDGTLFTSGPDTAEVTIKRDSGFAGSACSSRIYVNGAPVADIRSSQKIVVYLSKSEHILGASPNGWCGGGTVEVRADLRSGLPANFRVGYGSNDDFFITQTAF
jgi:hypothetical protein